MKNAKPTYRPEKDVLFELSTDPIVPHLLRIAELAREYAPKDSGLAMALEDLDAIRDVIAKRLEKDKKNQESLP